MPVLQRQGCSGARVAGGAATHRVHDDERRVPAGGERGVHLISGAELLEADPRQLLAHRLHEAGVVHGDVNARHIPRILKDSGSSITTWGMGSGTMGPRFALVAAVAALAAALALLRLDIPPVPTWFYVFAWYPALVILDAFVARLGGRSLLARPRELGCMLWWSAVIWFLFEALNFRLQDWYYVFLPDHRVERWLGITLSLATVVPAGLVAAPRPAVLGVGRRLSARPVGGRPGDPRGSPALRSAGPAPTLLLPPRPHPLTWGAVWLIAEPLLY